MQQREVHRIRGLLNPRTKLYYTTQNNQNKLYAVIKCNFTSIKRKALPLHLICIQLSSIYFRKRSKKITDSVGFLNEMVSHFCEYYWAHLCRSISNSSKINFIHSKYVSESKNKVIVRLQRILHIVTEFRPRAFTYLFFAVAAWCYPLAIV